MIIKKMCGQEKVQKYKMLFFFQNRRLKDNQKQNNI